MIKCFCIQELKFSKQAIIFINLMVAPVKSTIDRSINNFN